MPFFTRSFPFLYGVNKAPFTITLIDEASKSRKRELLQPWYKLALFCRVYLCPPPVNVNISRLVLLSLSLSLFVLLSYIAHHGAIITRTPSASAQAKIEHRHIYTPPQLFSTRTVVQFILYLHRLKCTHGHQSR